MVTKTAAFLRSLVGEDKDNIWRKVAIVFGGTIVLLWNLPWTVITPTSGLDPSWSLALGIAVQDGLQFGKNIIWTYGPLGFLGQPVFYPDHLLWLISALFGWAVYVCFVFMILSLAAKNAFKLSMVTLLMITVLQFVSVTAALIGIVALCMYYSAAGSGAVWGYIGCGLMAIVSLIKVSHLITAIVFVIILLVFFRKDKVLSRSIGLVIFIASWMAMWIGSGQEVRYIPKFLLGSLNLILGYTSAMSIHGETWQTIIGVVILASLLVGFTLMHIREVNTAKSGVYIFLMFAGFEAFKEGFVRHDPGAFGHADLFLSFAGICVGIMVGIWNNDGVISNAAQIVSLPLLIIAIYHGGYLTFLPSAARYVSWEQGIRLAKSKDARLEFQDSILSGIRSSVKLPRSIIKDVGKSTVSVIPWDSNIAVGYGMNQRLFPIIQNYSAYTTYLDRRNAEAVSDGEVGKYLIISAGSIDGRYPPENEPLTFDSIVNEYGYITHGNGRVLLKRVSYSSGSRKVMRCTKRKKAAFGQEITVPKDKSGIVLARIDIRYSFTGIISNILYKPPEIVFHMETKKGERYRFRFVPGVGSDGIIINKLIGNNSELIDLFRRHVKELPNISNVSFSSKGAYDYSGIKYRFCDFGLTY